MKKVNRGDFFPFPDDEVVFVNEDIEFQKNIENLKKSKRKNDVFKLAFIINKFLIKSISHSKRKAIIQHNQSLQKIPNYNYNVIGIPGGEDSFAKIIFNFRQLGFLVLNNRILNHLLQSQPGGLFLLMFGFFYELDFIPEVKFGVFRRVVKNDSLNFLR